MPYLLIGSPILLVLAAVWLGLSLYRGAISMPIGAVLGVGIAAGLYASLMLIDQGFDLRYRTWSGSPSFEDARESGRLVAVYTASCSDDRVAIRQAYAEQVTRKELGPLLWPRLIASDAVRVVAGMNDLGRPVPQLVFDDGGGVTIDQQTGVASPRTDDVDKNRCCFDFRMQAPERFWLVQNGEQICTFTRQPDA